MGLTFWADLKNFENVPPRANFVRVRAGNDRGPGGPSNEVIVIVFSDASATAWGHHARISAP